MGFLRTDYSNTGDFAPLPVGKYEAFISEVKVDESSTGKPMLKITLTIRDDVEQGGQKRKFFDNLVEQENMMWKFNQVAKAAQVPEGADIETLQEFAEAIQFKPVLIKNKHRVYNGETQDSVGMYLPSEVGGGFDHGEADPFGGADKIDISADDLPF
jgi:hypothetical protein